MGRDASVFSNAVGVAGERQSGESSGNKKANNSDKTDDDGHWLGPF